MPRERDHLRAVLIRSLDPHDRVLRRVVVREGALAHARAEGLDEAAVVGDDERGVIPVRVRPIRPGIAQALTDLDQTTEKLGTVGEDEIARSRVAGAIAGWNMLVGGDHFAASAGRSSAGGSFRL